MTSSITQCELRNSSGDIMRRLDETVAAMFHRVPAIDADRFRADLDAVADPGIDPGA